MSVPGVEHPSAALDRETLLQVAQTLSTGLAIVETERWGVLFENAAFFKWFPPQNDADEPLTVRMPDFKPDRAVSRTQGGRTYAFEVESESGGRNIPITVEVRLLQDGDEGRLVLECRDISKQAEYMLESYSSLAEKNARDLQREKERVERLLLNVMPRSV